MDDRSITLGKIPLVKTCWRGAGPSNRLLPRTVHRCRSLRKQGLWWNSGSTRISCRSKAFPVFGNGKTPCICSQNHSTFWFDPISENGIWSWTEWHSFGQIGPAQICPQVLRHRCLRCNYGRRPKTWYAGCISKWHNNAGRVMGLWIKGWTSVSPCRISDLVSSAIKSDHIWLGFLI